MIENRYDDTLREGNQLIIDITPSNYVLRIELSLEIKNILQDKTKSKVLEIGSGEGDLTKYILKNNTALHIDCLDISQEMIDSSKTVLGEYLERIHFITKDALAYLEEIDFTYDIITSARTLHNFTWENKQKVFEKIYANLSKNGKMLCMDKIYTDDPKEREKMLKTQLARYRYLDEQLRKDITDHEYQDLTDDYRMDESPTIEVLKKIGFRSIKIIDRVERDVIVVAEK